MNISELINIIKDIALEQLPVHSSFDGDVYENWDSKEIKYGSVNVALQSITYDGNLCTYSLILYYGDRLIQDKNNVNLIYSDGVVALQSIINTLEAEYGVDIPQSVIYTPFEQNFADYLAGVYATFDVITESELGYCSIAEMEEDSDSDSESDVPVDAVKFTANDASSIGLASLSTNQTLEYSNDGYNWAQFTTAIRINLEAGEYVYVRGQLSGNNSTTDYTKFEMTGSIAASGSMNYIWDYTNPEATSLSYTHCGYWMFDGCSSLTVAPELPATTLTEGCYQGMFSNCTALTTAPELPATTLAQSCYLSMFYSCTNLNYIKCLATDISASDCTRNWVRNVSATGTFVKNPEMSGWTIGFNGIPEDWEEIDNV